MNITPEVAISTVLIVASVGVTYGSLRTKLNDVVDDVKEIKQKVFNGHFVRRSECPHCGPLEDISND